MNKVSKEKLLELAEASKGGSLDRLGALAKPIVADMVQEILDSREKAEEATDKGFGVDEFPHVPETASFHKEYGVVTEHGDDEDDEQ